MIVPDSQLYYRRFYDFPPEPEYAHVKDATKKAVKKRRSLYVGKDKIEIDDATDLLFDEQMDSVQSFPDPSLFQPKIEPNGQRREYDPTKSRRRIVNRDDATTLRTQNGLHRTENGSGPTPE